MLLKHVLYFVCLEEWKVEKELRAEMGKHVNTNIPQLLTGTTFE